VRLKLRAALLVATRVIKRNAPLPELRGVVGDQRGDSVEPLYRVRDPAVAEIRHCAIKDRLGIVASGLPGRRCRE